MTIPMLIAPTKIVQGRGTRRARRDAERAFHVRNGGLGPCVVRRLVKAIAWRTA